MLINSSSQKNDTDILFVASQMMLIFISSQNIFSDKMWILMFLHRLKWQWESSKQLKCKDLQENHSSHKKKNILENQIDSWNIFALICLTLSLNLCNWTQSIYCVCLFLWLHHHIMDTIPLPETKKTDIIIGLHRHFLLTRTNIKLWVDGSFTQMCTVNCNKDTRCS